MWFEFEELDIPIAADYGAGMFEGRAYITCDRNDVPWEVDRCELMVWRGGKKIPVELGHSQRWLTDKIEAGLRAFKNDDVIDALYASGTLRKPSSLRSTLGLSAAQRGISNARMV